VLEPDFDFNGQIKEALRAFKKRYPGKIEVEEKLFSDELSKYYKTKMSGTLSIGYFLNSLAIARNDPFSYLDIGCKIQYYVEDKVLYFCTINTARERLVNWWKALPVEEKNKFH